MTPTGIAANSWRPAESLPSSRRQRSQCCSQHRCTVRPSPIPAVVAAQQPVASIEAVASTKAAVSSEAEAEEITVTETAGRKGGPTGAPTGTRERPPPPPNRKAPPVVGPFFLFHPIRRE